MRQCVKALRQRWKVTIVHYLDDILLLHGDREYLQRATTEIVRFMMYLGWVINLEKSNLSPSQKVQYLGWEWDSTSCSVRLPLEKVHAITHDLRAIHNVVSAQRTVTARKLARLIGTLNATRFQFRQASLYLQELNKARTAAVLTHGWDRETRIPAEGILQEIQWWLSALKTNEPRRIQHAPPQATVFTDASPLGWGAHAWLQQARLSVWMHGRWKKKATSNALECQAVERALRRLRQLPEAKAVSSVIIRSDNTATCYNINRRSACDTLLPALSRLLRFADSTGLQMTAEHVSGLDKITADRLSRISPGGDYALRMECLQHLQTVWKVQIDADLFAAGWNAKHPRYFSFGRDRLALGRDAFLTDCSVFRLPLLHPPIPLIPKVLRRLQQTGTSAVLIAPLWMRQTWSALLRVMTLRILDLGSADSVLVKGARMAKVRAELPPGNVGAFLLGSKSTTVSS
jgi:hypothetical protein